MILCEFFTRKFFCSVYILSFRFYGYRMKKESDIYFGHIWSENIFVTNSTENNTLSFKSKAIDYILDRNELATARCLVDWKSDDSLVSYYVTRAGVNGYFAAWQELCGGVEHLKLEYFSDGLYYVEAFMKYGCFGVMVKNDLQEEESKNSSLIWYRI